MISVNWWEECLLKFHLYFEFTSSLLTNNCCLNVLFRHNIELKPLLSRRKRICLEKLLTAYCTRFHLRVNLRQGQSPLLLLLKPPWVTIEGMLIDQLNLLYLLLFVCFLLRLKILPVFLVGRRTNVFCWNFVACAFYCSMSLFPIWALLSLG